MAPSKQAPGPPFAKDEKILCFHGDLMYEAKITEIRSFSDPNNTNVATIKADDAQYRIHYKGWKSSWDDWVPQDRIRKFTDDNRALAAQLQAAARARAASGGSKSAKKAIGKAVGGGDSEMSSARGSEERGALNSYAGRGPRRGRDYELESVSHLLLLYRFIFCFSFLVSLLALSAGLRYQEEVLLAKTCNSRGNKSNGQRTRHSPVILGCIHSLHAESHTALARTQIVAMMRLVLG
jgi:hypothetical protein